MAGQIGFEFSFKRPAGARRRSHNAFRILVIGDFSGAGASGDPDGAWPPPRAVDVDNFDEVMARVAPRIAAPGGVADQFLQFRDLDDFHPDALYTRLDLFAKLRDLRRRLADTQTFKLAAAELRASAAELTDADRAPGAANADGDEDDGATLARLLGTPAAAPHPQATVGGVLDDLIRAVVAPYVVAAPDPNQDLYLQAVDDAITGQMRALLHDANLQRLEASWRGLHRLVFDEAVAENTKISILDVALPSLRDDLASAGADLATSRLAPILLGPADDPGGEPWSLMVGDFYLTAAADDIRLLAACGALAAAAGAPLIAGAAPPLAGCASITAAPDPAAWQPLPDAIAGAWEGLRASPQAPWLGLALPRLLMRLPYGPRGESIDGFAFDELGPEPDHENFLWGNPAYGCALLIARAFAAREWAMTPGDLLDIDELPAYTWNQAGESKLQAGAEVFFGERGGQALLARGLMPLLSYRDRGVARVLRFQSLADPPAALAGPWSG